MHYIADNDTVPLPEPKQPQKKILLKAFLARQKSLFLVWVGAIFLLLLLIHTLQRTLWSQQDGVLGFAAIIAPYFFLPMLFLLPFCLLPHRGLLRIIFLLALCLFGICFPPQLHAAPQAPTNSRQISVMTWNFLADNKRGGSLRRLLNEKMPDIVALQEADWEGIGLGQDVLETYPYHLYRPTDGVPPGEAILSKYPILDYGIHSTPSSTWDIPRILWVRVDVGQGKTLTIVNAHPISAINTTYGCTYCPRLRDKQIHEINRFVAGLLQQKENVLLLGDMNITDRESAYMDLARGLRDAHLAVGNGPGHSWGLRQLNRFWAFVRIDYMFIGPTVTPLSLTTDCEATGSDHCALLGRFAL